MNFLFLGDSYTIGEAVKEKEKWPAQLIKALEKQKLKVASSTIIAKTGWTTDELDSAIATAHLNSTYDLVTLCIGVNNQYRGRSVENYTVEFEELLKQAIIYAGNDASRVLVVSIPDYGVTPFAKEKKPEKISSEIDEFNRINLQIARRYNAGYVEITTISKLAKKDLSLLAEDQLHPSAKMYSRWVDTMMPLVKTILEP
ncbi:MAG: SGNH/GDSL hydrolase family protein [Cyclobacteriaceae bacterium]